MIENYNKETKTLTIPYTFNEELKDIPKDTKIIIFNQNISKSEYSKFNQPVDNLPESLTHLTFGRNFNKPVNNLPKSLTNLTFGDYFNQLVVKLPETLTHLSFDYEFNQPVNNLPQSLTHLTFAEISKFNQSVDNLPENLTHLSFGYKFNQPVDNLPKGLTHLTFGYKFNQPVDNLPKGLTHLTFGYYFNQPVDNLPKNIYLLKLDCFNNNNFIIPKNVKELYIYNNNILINNLPENIEKINIFFDEENEINKIENLPLLLKEIIIENEHHKKYIKIPFDTVVTIKKIEK